MEMRYAGNVTYKRRWIVAVGVSGFIALLFLAVRVRPSLHDASANAGANGDTAAPGAMTQASAAELARRAAVAALGPIKNKGVNAADLYANAMALYDALSQEEKDMLALHIPPKKIDTATGAALYAKVQPIMELLRRARKADYVDWGMGPISVRTDMSRRVNQARDLGGVALWESNYRFQTDPDGAVGDLAALVAFGRAGTDTLLGLVFENNFQGAATNMIAQNAAEISSAAGADLANIMNGDISRQNYEKAMTGEAEMIQGVLAGDANTMSAMAGLDHPLSPAEFATAVNGLAAAERALAKISLEPLSQFQPQWNQIVAAAGAEPLVADTLKQFGLIVQREQSNLVRDAMLATGLAEEHGDQAAFQSIVDPSTGRPFGYTQTAAGFVLNSPTMFKGEAVSLNFATPSPK